MRVVWGLMDLKLPHLRCWFDHLDSLVNFPIMEGQECGKIDVDLTLNGKPFYNRLIETDKRRQLNFDDPPWGIHGQESLGCTVN